MKKSQLLAPWWPVLAVLASCAASPNPSLAPQQLAAPASERAPSSVEGDAEEVGDTVNFKAESPSHRPPQPSQPTAEKIGGPLTFDELIATALGESPDLRISAARVAGAEAGLAASRAAWWPTVGVDASYLRADAPSLYLVKAIDSGSLASGTDFNDPGAFSNWEAGVGLQFNLYNGGRDALNSRIADDTKALALLDADAIENALVAALTDGWYGVRAAEEQMRTAHASIRTVDAQLAEARARHAAGSGLKTDVLSLEVRRAESEELLLRATNGRELGLAALAHLAGLEDSSKLELIGEGSSRVANATSFEAALDQAYLSRPELAGARRAVERAERNSKVASSNYLPRADLFARGWRDSPELAFDESRDNWALGVSLSWDVFDGGGRSAGVDGARARLDEARRIEQKARLGVQLDVRSAWLRLADARARLEVTSRASETADETLKLVRTQYESGAAPITRYLEAELANTQTMTRRTSARYDHERAEADLARAVGHFKGATTGPPASNR